jgi:hypothetical protein
MRVERCVATWVGLGLLLCGWTVACGPAATPAATPTAGDPFAVVRATSQAAYASGKAHLDRGEFLQACVDLDIARTNDPDNRPEIDQALREALQRCLTALPEATSAPAQPLPTLAVPTLPAAAGVPTLPAAAGVATATQAAPTAEARTTVPTQPTPAANTGVAATAQPAASAATTPGVASAPATTPGAATAATTPGAASAAGATGAASGMVAWKDPQGRFSLDAPADWSTVPQPQSLFGTSVVEFQDPIRRAEVDVAVDSGTRAVSPELYAASMELAMQQQVPGYAAEQVVPGTTAGNPSVRRVFTFTQRDASGQDHQARGFQITLVKGSTPFIISGSAPAEQFQQFSPMFDRMVESFRFS